MLGFSAATLASDKAWLALVGIAVTLSYYTYCWYREPLRPVIDADIVAGRLFAWSLVALVVVAVTVTLLFQ